MKKEISISNLVEKISSLMVEDFSIKSSMERIRPNKSEVDRLICDNSKLITHSSWSPKYTLDQGIKEVIEWMRLPENMNMYKPKIYNV